MILLQGHGNMFNAQLSKWIEDCVTNGLCHVIISTDSVTQWEFKSSIVVDTLDLRNVNQPQMDALIATKAKENVTRTMIFP